MGGIGDELKRKTNWVGVQQFSRRPFFIDGSESASLGLKRIGVFKIELLLN